MSFEIFTEEDRKNERELLASYDLDVKFFKLLDFKISQIVPERNCFRIETDKGFYCLKKMNFLYEDIYLMLGMTEHLRNNGFANTFDIVLHENNEILIPYEGNQYYLSRWMDGRESDYLNLLDIKNAIEALAKFHIGTEGFQTKYDQGQRRLYGRWKQGFLQKLNEIEAAKELVITEGKRYNNGSMIIQYLTNSIRDAKYTLNLIEKSSYIRLNARDEGKKGFIHHDYGFHNILHTFDNQTYIGGLEKSAFDIRMHDLSYFIFRLMRRKGWDIEAAINIIDYYNEIYKLEKEDYEALAVYFAFPHDFKLFYKQYYTEGRETVDPEELERINVESEYNQARRGFLIEFEKYSALL
ncbi:MAG TPA: CotS family spore coat protein [Methanosarcinales archaeon]|nr:CotS family spore coat protein [Methanosarcinales archaeon]